MVRIAGNRGSVYSNLWGKHASAVFVVNMPVTQVARLIKSGLYEHRAGAFVDGLPGYFPKIRAPRERIDTGRYL